MIFDKINKYDMIAAPVDYKWYKFHAYPNAKSNRKYPPIKKYVLVRIKSLDKCVPDAIAVGYMKYHAGVKSEPYFVTPGSISGGSHDGRVIEWCDCLPYEMQTLLWNG